MEIVFIYMKKNIKQKQHNDIGYAVFDITSKGSDSRISLKISKLQINSEEKIYFFVK